jgi:hypothetical protein
MWTLAVEFVRHVAPNQSLPFNFHSEAGISNASITPDSTRHSFPSNLPSPPPSSSYLALTSLSPLPTLHCTYGPRRFLLSPLSSLHHPLSPLLPPRRRVMGPNHALHSPRGAQSYSLFPPLGHRSAKQLVGKEDFGRMVVGGCRFVAATGIYK